MSPSQVIKSPFTGSDAELKQEARVQEYRKDTFDVVYHYYEEVDSGEEFTTTEIDTLNLGQLHNQYREKYGIPFTEEIRGIRKYFGLSAAAMSRVLGLGINVYRNYEGGEMPSVATGRLIRLAQEPGQFRKLLEMSGKTIEPKEYEEIKRKLDQAQSHAEDKEEKRIDGWFDSNLPTIYNGYKVPNLQRIGTMVRYFALNNQAFITTLNRLMFYSDFGHFKQFGFGISGIYYKGLRGGPAPSNYGALYNSIVNKGLVNYGGDRFIAERECAAFDPGEQLLSETEWMILKKVSDRFKELTTKKVVDISHKELAWLNDEAENCAISYDYAFVLPTPPSNFPPD